MGVKRRSCLPRRGLLANTADISIILPGNLRGLLDRTLARILKSCVSLTPYMCACKSRRQLSVP